MAWCFDYCMEFGTVYLSEDGSACALLTDQKPRTTLRSLIRDAKLILGCLGYKGAMKATSREKRIKKHHPDKPFIYLWYIGVNPTDQHKGIGSQLLRAIIAEANKQQYPICLETSTPANLPWYQKFGFRIYHELDLGYKLFMLRIDP